MTKAQTYWSDTIVHEATGVTYFFSEPVEYGHYWNGDVFVVSNGGDIVITNITPEDIPGDGRVMHGAMLQPDDTKTYAFDDGAGYDALENVDPSVTGTPLRIEFSEYPGGASLVKAVSLEDLSTQRDRSVIDKFSVLTITPETPPENAFRPPVAGDNKVSLYTLSDLDFSKLQSVEPVFGQQSISDFNYLTEATFVSWWSGEEDLRYFHPNSYHDGYTDYQLDDIIGAFMALHTNASAKEKEPLYAAIVQQGIDYGGGIAQGVRWIADGGHSNLYKPFVVTAASALNSSDLKSIASEGGIFSEDTQFRYITSEDVGVAFFESTTRWNPKLGREYQDVHVGMPEWTIRDQADGRFDPDLSAVYRWVNSDNVPILALTMEMMGGGEGRSIWNNEAYFDYAERVRLMHQIDVTPTIDADRHTHMAEPEWMAFLDAYHREFSSGATMNFLPEAPLEVSVSTSEGGLDITVGGEVFFGSSPISRVDVRYRSAGDDEAWVVLEDFGMSGRIDGMIEGNLYFVQARYVSPIGEGPWSHNGFSGRNSHVIDRLKADGFITDAFMDTFGGQRQYQKSDEYKDHLWSILSGSEGYEVISDDLLVATAILHGSGRPSTVLQPDPIADPAPADILDLNGLLIEDFQAGKQDLGDHGVSEDGATLRLDSQAWQSVLMDVEVTADTWLSFDFSADVEGEVHGIMFTNGDKMSSGTGFAIFGTDNWNGAIQDYTYDGSGSVQRIEIPVGAHFTGSFDRIVFLTDDDENVGADSTFANVTLSTGVEPADVFLAGAMLSSSTDVSFG
jgi:hypothetical protein